MSDPNEKLCKSCAEFFSHYRCNKPRECDCPKCQGYCECGEQIPHLTGLEIFCLRLNLTRCRAEAQMAEFAGSVNRAVYYRSLEAAIRARLVSVVGEDYAN